MKVLETEQLIEILKDLPQYYPRSLQMIALLQNRLEKRFDWPGMEFVVDEYPDYSVVMLRPIKGDSTFVARPLDHSVSLFCKNLTVFKKVIQEKDFVDWTQAVVFLAVSEDDVAQALIENPRKDFGISRKIEAELEAHYVCTLLPDKLEAPPLPEGFKLGELKPEHAPLVAERWATGRPEVVNYFLHLFTNGYPTSAIFDKSNYPVAHILYANDGSMASGYVDPKHRRRGFYQIVCYDLVRKLLNMQLNVCGDRGTVAWAYVEPSNKASWKALCKMGAEVEQKYLTTFIVHLPPNLDHLYSQMSKDAAKEN